MHIAVLEERLLRRHFVAKYSLKINSREKYHPAILFELQFLPRKEKETRYRIPVGGN